MPAHAKPINLLPPSDFEDSFWGKFLKWAVSTGRYIIILTELVVIVAFLSRFKLDQDISKLSSEIEGKRNILAAYQPKEKEFVETQNKIKQVKALLQSQIKAKDQVVGILQYVPEGLKFTSLTLEPKQSNIKAVSPSNTEFSQMLYKLISDNLFESVDIAEVKTDDTKSVVFSLNLAQ